jgi:hypothetical protein
MVSRRKSLAFLLVAICCTGCATASKKYGRTPWLSQSIVYATENLPYMICFPREYAENARVSRKNAQTQLPNEDRVTDDDTLKTLNNTPLPDTP